MHHQNVVQEHRQRLLMLPQPDGHADLLPLNLPAGAYMALPLRQNTAFQHAQRAGKARNEPQRPRQRAEQANIQQIRICCAVEAAQRFLSIDVTVAFHLSAI